MPDSNRDILASGKPGADLGGFGTPQIGRPETSRYDPTERESKTRRSRRRRRRRRSRRRRRRRRRRGEFQRSGKFERSGEFQRSRHVIILIRPLDTWVVERQPSTLDPRHRIADALKTLRATAAAARTRISHKATQRQNQEFLNGPPDTSKRYV